MEKNGKVTILADHFEGKRLNAPNAIIVKSDDTIWFSDPLFGINGDWEGNKEKPEQATTNVYRIGTDDFDAVADRFVNAARAMQRDGWWDGPATTDRAIRRRILREMIVMRFRRARLHPA